MINSIEVHLSKQIDWPCFRNHRPRWWKSMDWRVYCSSCAVWRAQVVSVGLQRLTAWSDSIVNAMESNLPPLVQVGLHQTRVRLEDCSVLLRSTSQCVWSSGLSITMLTDLGFVAPTWLRPEILSFSLLCIPRPGCPISNRSSRGAWVLFLARNIESCCHFICSLAQGSVVFVFGCSSFHSWWSSPLPSDPIVCSLSRSLSLSREVPYASNLLVFVAICLQKESESNNFIRAKLATCG